MNVGILTFHMAHNCGAMLQTFALYTYISSVYSLNCEVIDYRLKEIYGKYEQMLKAKEIEPKRIKFENYMQEKLPLSKRLYNLSDTKPYDLYIIGGDQVWNPNITMGYKDEYFAKLFPENAFCISYAASAGNSIDSPKKFAERLSSFKFVSVRELSLKNEISPFFEKEIACVLDPVLLINPEKWHRSCKLKFMQRYILIYSFSLTDNEYQDILCFALKHALPIIELVTHRRTIYSKITYENDYGPEEWLLYMQNASVLYH